MREVRHWIRTTVNGQQSSDSRHCEERVPPNVGYPMTVLPIQSSCCGQPNCVPRGRGTGLASGLPATRPDSGQRDLAPGAVNLLEEVVRTCTTEGSTIVSNVGQSLSLGRIEAYGR